MELPMHPDALLSAKGAKERRRALSLPLEFAALKAGECSITHDA